MKPMSSRPMNRMSDWWQQRDPRERVMLTVMCVAIAAFLLWYGAFVPLRHARDAAQARHVSAVAELARVQAELAQLSELRDRLPAARVDAGTLQNAVLASAAQAGLQIGNERSDDSGALEIDSDGATPAQVFGWLDALHAQHGLSPASLSVARNQDRLRVQARFLAPTP